jgi:hypothetical protein
MTEAPSGGSATRSRQLRDAARHPPEVQRVRRLEFQLSVLRSNGPAKPFLVEFHKLAIPPPAWSSC